LNNRFLNGFELKSSEAMQQIDINCDMGESYGAGLVGNDEVLMPLVSSANIACGFHGGDPSVMHRTVTLAVKHGVSIGAHPSYPDLQGFGRRQMEMSAQEIYDLILYQTGALESFVRAAGATLHHVKPHGALYNQAAKDAEMAASIVHAIYYFNKELCVYGPPGSALEKAALGLGLAFCAEAFADRTYQEDGSLTPRTETGALIRDVVQALHQVHSIVEQQTVKTLGGTTIPMPAGTICIHGDGLHAAEFAAGIRKSLTEKGIRIQSPHSAS
jgi:5-oxoprolinase (ATP-hydrolysing) subunit A